MSAASNDQSRRDTECLAVPLLDLKCENSPLREPLLAAIAGVFDSGMFLHGPDVQQLEQSVAQLCESEFAVGCGSGSDAVLLALMAYNVGPGDEVIVPSFTFFATASAVWRLGARPVFVDIDPQTFNIDVRSIEQALTPATKAMIPVHMFGQCADMDAICELARGRGLHVIEDAAQAVGAKYKQRPAGSMGDVGCFSFYPTKNLGAFGNGGMLTTSNAEVAERLRLLAVHGMHPRYYHNLVGINSRLDSIQAAVLNVKLAHLAGWTAKRQANAAKYHQLFAAGGIDQSIHLPMTAADRWHIWNQYTIRVPGGQRDALRAALAGSKIGSEIYYPVPLHLQECFRELNYAPGSLPETEQAAREVLSLPIFPYLADEQLHRVVQGIRDFYAGRQVSAA